MVDGMTGQEVLRLIEWLRSKGHDEKEIVDCIEQVEGKEKEKM